MTKRLIFPLLAASVIILGTILVIKLAKGYRPNLSRRQLQGTGLLVANSFPSGAQVFLNGKLTTATDDTLNLPPGEYRVTIAKDGFSPWEKTLTLEAELVTQTNATLFPAVPTLRPLTFVGATHLSPSPNGQKLAYIVTAATSTNQNGLWVLDLNPGTPFIRAPQSRQISRVFWTTLSSSTGLPRLTWSPDSSQILVHLEDQNYLLDPNRLNDGQLRDVTARWSLILSEWEEQLVRLQRPQLLTLPVPLHTLLLDSATNFYFSPDETKLLYTATQSLTLPDHLVPSLPASSSQAQQRQLEPGATYVYDLKEDRNFRVLDPLPAELGQPTTKISLVTDLSVPLASSPSAYRQLQTLSNFSQALDNLAHQYSPINLLPLQWFPDSTHLVLSQPDKISLLDYDGLNLTTIYSGIFDPGFVYPSPTGSQLLILANLNQDSKLSANIYGIDLK